MANRHAKQVPIDSPASTPTRPPPPVGMAHVSPLPVRTDIGSRTRSRKSLLHTGNANWPKGVAVAGLCVAAVVACPIHTSAILHCQQRCPGPSESVSSPDKLSAFGEFLSWQMNTASGLSPRSWGRHRKCQRNHRVLPSGSASPEPGTDILGQSHWSVVGEMGA